MEMEMIKSCFIVALTHCLLATAFSQTLSLSLGSTPINNDSFVIASDVGNNNDNALLCRTNETDCCGGENRTGEWYLPNGTVVGSFGDNGGNIKNDFFSRNRGQSVVRLNQYNSPSERGRFSCELLGDTIYVNIISFTVSTITPSGTSTAGSSYSLECSVTVNGSTATPTITWLDPMNSTVPSDMVSTTGSMSTLTFNSLSASHAGTYTCNATLGGATAAAMEEVTVQVPAPSSVTVTSDQPNPLAVRPVGMATVTLTCTVVLDSSVDVPVTVNTVWIGPDNFNRNIMAQQMGNTTTYTSTVMVSSFGRDQSGDYTCTATVSSTSPFITGSMSSSPLTRVTVGVYLSLKGVVLPHNTAIMIDDIGETDTSSNDGLQCITDRMPCCRTSQTGEWNFPGGGGTVPGHKQSPTTFFRNRGEDGTVNLNRVSNTVMMPTGQYCCEVPDATGVNQMACAIIFSVQLTASQPSPRAGNDYTLTCNVSGINIVTNMRWTNGSVISGQAGETLSFSPLRLTDAGQYCCNVTVNGTMYSSCTTLAVINPVQPPVVTVNSTRFPNVVPFNVFTLSCNASVEPDIHNNNIDLNVTLKRGTGEDCRDVTSVAPGTVQTSNQYHHITQTFSEVNSSVYCYQCRAELSSEELGDTHMSANQTINVTFPSVPRRVANVTSFNVTQHSAAIGWTVAYLEYTPEEYKVHYNKSESESMISSEKRGIGSNFTLPLNLPLNITISMLSPGTEYTYYINAINSIGSTQTDIHSFTTVESLPGRVTGLSAMDGSGELIVTWRPPVSPNGIILYYELCVGSIGSTQPFNDCMNTTLNTTHHVDMLEAGVPYSVTVTPVNSAGPGEPASAIGFSEQLTPTLAPSVTVSRISPTAVDVSWHPLSLEEARGFVSSYTVTYYSNSSRSTMYETALGNSTSLLISQLNPEWTYYIQVWANTRAGAGPASEPVPIEAVSQGMPANMSGVAAAIVLVLVGVVSMATVSAIVAWRLKNRSKVRAKFSGCKPRTYLTGRSKSLEEDTYTACPVGVVKEEGEGIELREEDEIQDKDKDYYFVDTSLIASEHLKPVPVSEFSSHVERLHADRDKLFEMEYTNIPKTPLSSYAVSELPHNKMRNRFGNIFPYDTSRVKLKEIAGEEGSDYINASYLSGYNKPKPAYIGAQGPMPNTVTDFWRMIWEKKLPTIVMLTKCFEGRKKCEEYWPVNVGERVEPGHGLHVTLTSMLPFAEYSVRMMTLTQPSSPGSATLKLTQFHFTGWPDHGVPQNGVVLINFIKRVRSSHPYTDSRPLLVHCSAGVGRTGAFIVLDSMLQRMKVEENINILEFVTQMRAQRVLMVQTQSQYNFIHDALNELILCGDTEVTATNLRIVIGRLSQIGADGTGYRHQFNLLSQMTPPTSESDYTQAKLECNVSKNCYLDVLPDDHHRVLLRATGSPGSDYINASFIDGYRQRGAYIATQTPMENTVNDFWRMIWEYQSRSVVMLCRMKEDGQEARHAYFPEHKGGCEVYGKVVVKLISQLNSTDYIIRKLEVFEDKTHPQGSTPSAHPVTIFQYLRWPKHGTPRVTSALLQLMEHVNKTQMSSGNKPVTVMCNDGVGRTGTFICIHAQLERLKTEGVVDFFQSIKSARIQRAGLVPDVQQYMFCHSVVADYLDGFDTYANFKELV